MEKLLARYDLFLQKHFRYTLTDILGNTLERDRLQGNGITATFSIDGVQGHLVAGPGLYAVHLEHRRATSHGDVEAWDFVWQF